MPCATMSPGNCDMGTPVWGDIQALLQRATTTYIYLRSLDTDLKRIPPLLETILPMSP